MTDVLPSPEPTATAELHADPCSPAGVHAEFTEQLMRLTDDDTAVAALLAADPASLRALALLGRFLGSAVVPIQPGSPVSVWASGGALDARWRERSGPTAGSLWAQLAFLHQMYGRGELTGAAVQAGDPFELLQQLRARAEQDLSG